MVYEKALADASATSEGSSSAEPLCSCLPNKVLGRPVQLQLVGVVDKVVATGQSSSQQLEKWLNMLLSVHDFLEVVPEREWPASGCGRVDSCSSQDEERSSAESLVAGKSGCFLYCNIVFHLFDKVDEPGGGDVGCQKHESSRGRSQSRGLCPYVQRCSPNL